MRSVHTRETYTQMCTKHSCATRCRLAAAAVLGPCQCVSAGSQLQTISRTALPLPPADAASFLRLQTKFQVTALREALAITGKALAHGQISSFFTFCPYFSANLLQICGERQQRSTKPSQPMEMHKNFFSISAIVSFPKVFATLQDGLVIFPSKLEKKSTPDLHTIFQPREVCVAASWQRPSHGRQVRVSDPQIFSREPNARSDQVTGA